MREKAAVKRQICKDTYHNEKSSEFNINTREVQTESSMTTPEVMPISTLVSRNNFKTQYNIEPRNYVEKDEESQSECESSDKSEYHQMEREYDNDSCLDVPSYYSGCAP